MYRAFDGDRGRLLTRRPGKWEQTWAGRRVKQLRAATVHVSPIWWLYPATKAFKNHKSAPTPQKNQISDYVGQTYYRQHVTFFGSVLPSIWILRVSLFFFNRFRSETNFLFFPFTLCVTSAHLSFYLYIFTQPTLSLKRRRGSSITFSVCFQRKQPLVRCLAWMHAGHVPDMSWKWANSAV